MIFAVHYGVDQSLGFLHPDIGGRPGVPNRFFIRIWLLYETNGGNAHLRVRTQLRRRIVDDVTGALISTHETVIDRGVGVGVWQLSISFTPTRRFAAHQKLFWIGSEVRSRPSRDTRNRRKYSSGNSGWAVFDPANGSNQLSDVAIELRSQ